MSPHYDANMHKTLTITLLIIIMWCGFALSQAPAAAKEYAVPGHGKLHLSISESWKVAFQPIPKPQAINLEIRPSDGMTFDLQITSVPLDRKSQMNTDSEVQESVRQTGEHSLPNAVEKELKLSELHGAQSAGWYFALTDRAPGPGEFAYMKQGIFRTGELLNTFTLLSSAPNSDEVRQVMEMLRVATYSAK